MARRIRDDDGHVIPITNADRCRDCGGEDRLVDYVQHDFSGRVTESYAQCYDCDPERGLYES